MMAVAYPNCNCMTCGSPTDICWADGGALALVHGLCQCRACYAKNGHPECPRCHELNFSQSNYCSHCGQSLKGQPTIEDIGGSDPDFPGGKRTEDYVRDMREEA